VCGMQLGRAEHDDDVDIGLHERLGARGELEARTRPRQLGTSPRRSH
jgi:hypothetical protein